MAEQQKPGLPGTPGVRPPVDDFPGPGTGGGRRGISGSTSQTLQIPGVSGAKGLTIADGGAGTLRFSLNTRERVSASLIQAMVYIQAGGGIGADTDAEEGPVWVELWLHGQGREIMLDSGFVRSGGARGLRSVVGFSGSLLTHTGDQLLVITANDSGASVTLALSAALAPLDVHPPTGTFVRLSTERWALWAWRAVITQQNAAGGAVILDFPSVAGDAESLASLDRVPFNLLLCPVRLPWYSEPRCGPSRRGGRP